MSIAALGLRLAAWLLLWAFVGVPLAFLGRLPAAEYFVAPGGDDVGPGTIERPLRSLEGARNRLRLLDSKGGEPLTVTLRGGTFRLSSPLLLQAGDGGTPGFPVTYRAFPGETPVLSGGVSVTGWRVHDAARRIYSAEVPVGTESWDFFVGGKRCPRGRRSVGFPGAFEATVRGIRVESRAVANWGGTDLPELVLRSEWATRASA